MKKICSLLLLILVSNSFAQNVDFKRHNYEWANKKPDLIKMNESFSTADAVVIDEDVKFILTNRVLQTLTKKCIVKINTAKGLERYTNMKLPESFDPAADKYYYQQGMNANPGVPFIYKFKLNYFASRILKKNGDVVEVPLDVRTEKATWVTNEGWPLEDFSFNFKNANLEPGDYLEYTYQIQFRGRYGTNIIYFNDEIPKQNSRLEVRYIPIPLFEEYKIIFNSNIDSTLWSLTSEYDSFNKKIFIYTYNFTNLAAINYPANTKCGKQLPHVTIDFNFLSYYGESRIPFETGLYPKRGSNFEWLFEPLGDSLGYQPSLYDKQHAALRKFLTKIPEGTPDNIFYTSLMDSLNAQKFVSALSMKMSGTSQYSVCSGEWLTKRKLMGEFLFELYWELLNEKKRTTYFVQLQDKRLGEAKFESRPEYLYEYTIMGVPSGKSVKLITPRFRGLQYNAEELPFYMEGCPAALMGVHFGYFDMNNFTTSGDYHSLARVVDFIKTPASTENENVRTENAVFQINLDSSVVHAAIKENLNGQFSTLLRPLYLGEAIDSTVNPMYFRKCTQKPDASNIKIKSSSKSNVFPFKHSFSCTEDLRIANKSELSLKNWFSFTFNGSPVKELPNFDYYNDFRYSDLYNYMLQFNKPVTIENVADFTKSVNNKYFELNSSLTKQSDTNYLLSVTVKVKQERIPKEEGKLLVDLVAELNALNNGALHLK